MSANLVAALLQIRIVGQIIASLKSDRTNTFDLGLNGIHYSDRVNIPDERGLPIHRRNNAFQRLICRDLIAALLASDAHDPGRKEHNRPKHETLRYLGAQALT